MNDPFDEALRLQHAAAAEGFDWDDPAALWEKLTEEIAELREAKDAAQREDELGDLLFMVVNLARHLGVGPAKALHGANEKFRRRYSHIAAHAAELPPLGSPTRLVRMEMLWQDAKALEKINK